MKAKSILVIALIALLLIPSAIGSPQTQPSYTVTKGFINVPNYSDVGNLTGLFITHDVVYYNATLNTPYGNLIVTYGKADRNRNGSYDFSFFVAMLVRDSNYRARIVSIDQTIVEYRGTYTSTIHQSYYYNATEDKYYRSPSSLKSVRVRTGNYTFFTDMTLNPHQVVKPTSETKAYLFVPFYILDPSTTSVSVTLKITLLVNNELYSLQLTANPSIYQVSTEVRLGNKQTDTANVVVGQRVLFRILFHNVPTMALSIADEFATITEVTLPNMYRPIPINATYPTPPPSGAAGALVGRPLISQAVYDTDHHTLSLALPITAQVVKQDFKVYIFYPVAYRVYLDPLTLSVNTGVVREYITIHLNSVSQYKERLNLVAVGFVIFLIIITIITLRIIVKTMRS